MIRWDLVGGGMRECDSKRVNWNERREANREFRGEAKGCTPPRVFSVRVANEGLMVDARQLRVKGEAGEERLTVEGLELKEQEQDNAPSGSGPTPKPRPGWGRRRAQRFRREGWVAGTGRQSTDTSCITICANTLSSVYCSAIQTILGKVFVDRKLEVRKRRKPAP
jgi:hypothetical protein